MEAKLSISEVDITELMVAKRLLENPGLAAKITNFIGSPIEKGIDSLPKKWTDKLGDITTNSLLKAADAAIFTMKNKSAKKSSNRIHKTAVAVSGGVGGFFGLAALAIELPISTTIMLRSIADISREYGESVNSIETKMACLEVFALGGTSTSDDGTETGYFTIRALLGQSVSETSKFILEKGVVDEGAPLILRLVTKVAERFSIQISEKMAGQAIPFIGAAGGAIINTVFMDHFQDMAKGHFIVRKQERLYGQELVKACYKSIKV
ncbi:EcsC family protein [Bizionia gelidisalsuginis]|uniref:EcsC family protein n=1 Tax=Bizionia gelidisalsuginis TaxID=291188 RepID=A0ABY3M9I7_9FLAO|nr:EcsC family protein [Bizionia gelidisalsuginis]TYC11408.1 EcsC family protein [Bizionia gelidisalsuginis]